MKKLSIVLAFCLSIAACSDKTIEGSRQQTEPLIVEGQGNVTNFDSSVNIDIGAIELKIPNQYDGNYDDYLQISNIKNGIEINLTGANGNKTVQIIQEVASGFKFSKGRKSSSGPIKWQDKFGVDTKYGDEVFTQHFKNT